MKVKICHFVNIITGKSDGVYAHLKMIFKYTDANKFQHYIVFQGNPNIEKELTTLGVKVVVFNSLNKRIPLRCFFDFFRLIRREKIDIIHTHFLKPYSIAGVLNIFLRKSLIFNDHGYFIDNKYNTRTDKIVYRAAHFIIHLFNTVTIAISPSYGSKEMLLKETKYFPDIKVYYDGYDNILENQCDNNLVKYIENLKSTYQLVGIVARIDMQKRIDIALEIAKIIITTNKHIFFVFMGDGALEAEMKSHKHSLGLDNNVILTGFIPNAKLYIKYFDLLLFTSDWEGLPITLWEAMAAGVPIISTDTGGIKEILLKENCGVIFPKGDIGKGANHILDLLKNENKRIQMGNNGIKAIKERYNSDKFAEFFNNLYLELSDH